MTRIISPPERYNQTYLRFPDLRVRVSRARVLRARVSRARTSWLLSSSCARFFAGSGLATACNNGQGSSAPQHRSQSKSTPAGSKGRSGPDGGNNANSANNNNNNNSNSNSSTSTHHRAQSQAKEAGTIRLFGCICSFDRSAS